MVISQEWEFEPIIRVVIRFGHVVVDLSVNSVIVPGDEFSG